MSVIRSFLGNLVLPRLSDGSGVRSHAVSLTRTIARNIARARELASRGPLRELDAKLDRLHRAFGEEEPRLLYHFTREIGAVEGILRSRKIWAIPSTDVYGDREELQTGEEIAQDLARSMARTRPFAQEVLAGFAQSFETKRISVVAQVFLSCFSPSATADHWKEYAAGGQGFALGFRLVPGRYRGRERTMDVLLMRVYYDPAVVRDRLDAVFRSALELGEATIAAVPDREKDIIAMTRATLYRLAALAAVQTKRQRFEHETEWRLVVVPKPGAVGLVKTSPRRHIPIELLPGRKPDIAGVYVGANHPDSAAAAEQIRRVLRERRYPPHTQVRVADATHELPSRAV